MTLIEIRPDLATKLREKAERENRSVDDILEAYMSNNSATDDFSNDIIRSIRAGFYERARRYWKETGNLERLALTDEQLDEQFWLFDIEGIPRLKSERGTITLPDDPLVQMAEAAERFNWHSGRSDISENTNEILWEITPNRVGNLTPDELRLLIREELRPLVRESEQEMLENEISEDDFDDNTNFKPEVAEQLRRFLKERPRGKPVDDLVKELGLDE